MDIHGLHGLDLPPCVPTTLGIPDGPPASPSRPVTGKVTRHRQPWHDRGGDAVDGVFSLARGGPVFHSCDGCSQGPVTRPINGSDCGLSMGHRLPVVTLKGGKGGWRGEGGRRPKRD